MKETDFQRRVLDIAARFGWKTWHVPAPMRATTKGGWVGAKEAAGLCDLIMIHHDPPLMILAELKGDGGKLSDKQVEFLAAARTVAERTNDEIGKQPYVGVYAWWPVDEPIIETILRTRVLI